MAGIFEPQRVNRGVTALACSSIMTTHILTPIDGSEQSYAGLAYGLASFPDARFTAMHIIDRRRHRDEGPGASRPWEERAEEQAERFLERAQDMADDNEQSIETEVAFGTPHKQLIRYALDADIDHVIVGSHGRSPIKSPFLGRVSEALLRRLPVSVTIVSAPLASVEQTNYPGHILLPVDGSRHAMDAIEWVAASFPTASVTVLHVLDVPFEYTEEARGTYVEGLLEELRAPGEEILVEAASKLEGHGIQTETDLSTGKPSSSIIAYATVHETDQIVMGSAGRSDLRNVLVGSVAERVARDSPLPVTLIR